MGMVKHRAGASSRVIAKASADPFYASVLIRYGAEHLEAAGFFDDGVPVGCDISKTVDDRLLVTPLIKICDAINEVGAESNKPIAVLVTSGGFCPIHNGHLAMMESARLEVEKRGWRVVGGFFAPDHDGYVRTKCGEEALSGAERTHLARLATSESTWLDVDPWAALYLDRAVNYTDIVRRLSRYLTLQVGHPIEIFFVCGGDNAGFSKAFLDHGRIVIVPRAGTDGEALLDPLAARSERVFVARDHTPNAIASRVIRKGRSGGLPPKVSQELCALQATKVPTKVELFLRDEEAWSTDGWSARVGVDLEWAQRAFVGSLATILERAFRRRMPHATVSVTRVSLSEQRRRMDGVIVRSHHPVISLDACIDGDHSIAISRRFNVTSGERLSGIFPRPGSADLGVQIAAIPDGSYLLMDDDIATGRTIREVCQLLPQRIHIEGVISVQEVCEGVSLRTVECSAGEALVEAGDVRDFLVGSREGGLVVRLPGGAVARVPYLLPYVQNSRRMSVPLEEEVALSQELWELNRQFFKSLPVALTIGDCPEAFQALALEIGFSSSCTMEAFCAWHCEQMRSSDRASRCS